MESPAGQQPSRLQLLEFSPKVRQAQKDQGESPGDEVGGDDADDNVNDDNVNIFYRLSMLQRCIFTLVVLSCIFSNVSSNSLQMFAYELNLTLRLSMLLSLRLTAGQGNSWSSV